METNATSELLFYGSRPFSKLSVSLPLNLPDIVYGISPSDIIKINKNTVEI